MSRPLRIEYPGAWYHVMNRGRRREDIFHQKEDYDAFLQIVRETVEVWNLKVSAYSLLPNHYHLLVQTPEGNISRCMRHINGVYTQRFNRSHDTDGQLFRGRYKAVLVEGDSHLLEVMRYIHRNPLRAGLIECLDDYPWSSHLGYLSLAKRWNWLHRDFLLAMLSIENRRRKSAYINFVAQGEPEEITNFYSMKKLPSLLGGEKFSEWIKEKYYHLGLQQEVPEAQILSLTPQEIIVQVCRYFNLDEATLKKSRRGVENMPRDIAIYLTRHYCRKGLTEIGEHFGLSNYSTVSSAVERIKVRKNKDRDLQQHLEDLTSQIVKSQRQT